MINVIDNKKYYVKVKQDITAIIIEGGAAFWSRPPEEISAAHPELMVVKFAYKEDMATSPSFATRGFWSR